jgi:hypothetical protein
MNSLGSQPPSSGHSEKILVFSSGNTTESTKKCELRHILFGYVTVKDGIFIKFLRTGNAIQWRLPEIFNI